MLCIHFYSDRINAHNHYETSTMSHKTLTKIFKERSKCKKKTLVEIRCKKRLVMKQVHMVNIFL